MSATILVKIGRKYYKVRVNPARQKLRGAISRQKKRGRLASAIRLELRLRKLLQNPLIKSADRAAINANIKYLMQHPGELTAKNKKMRHKQAIAIAMSVWRKAAGLPRYKKNPRRNPSVPTHLPLTLAGETRDVSVIDVFGNGSRLDTTSDVALFKVGRTGTKLWPERISFWRKPDGSYKPAMTTSIIRVYARAVAWNDAEFKKYVSKR